MSFTSGCCQGACDQNGVPRALAIYLNGYTDDTSAPSTPRYFSNLNNANGPSHAELGLLNVAPPAYVLYASSLGTGGACSYDLLYGPAMYLDYNADPDDETAPRDVRVEISATIDVESGSPTLTVNVGNGWSTFKVSLGTAPVNCTAIGSGTQLSVPLSTNGISTYGTNAQCWVQALAPARDCTQAFGPCSGGSSGSGSSGSGGSSSPNPFSRLRQPGTSTKCFGGCNCCICNAYGRTASFLVYFVWPAAGDDVCGAWDINFGGSGPHTYNLPKVSDTGAECVYALQTSILGWYLVLTLGFDGDPSQKGVYAQLTMGSGWSLAAGWPAGGVKFTFEAEHLEFDWMEAVLGMHWGGPGTFPCSRLGNPNTVYLPLVIENMVDDQPCDIRDMREVQCFIAAQGPTIPNPANPCCCPGTQTPPPFSLCIAPPTGTQCAGLPCLMALLPKGSATWSGSANCGTQGIAASLSYAGNAWTLTLSGQCTGTVTFNQPYSSLPCLTGTLSTACCTQPLNISINCDEKACLPGTLPTCCQLAQNGDIPAGVDVLCGSRDWFDMGFTYMAACAQYGNPGGGCVILQPGAVAEACVNPTCTADLVSVGSGVPANCFYWSATLTFTFPHLDCTYDVTPPNCSTSSTPAPMTAQMRVDVWYLLGCYFQVNFSLIGAAASFTYTSSPVLFSDAAAGNPISLQLAPNGPASQCGAKPQTIQIALVP